MNTSMKTMRRGEIRPHWNITGIPQLLFCSEEDEYENEEEKLVEQTEEEEEEEEEEEKGNYDEIE